MNHSNSDQSNHGRKKHFQDKKNSQEKHLRVEHLFRLHPGFSSEKQNQKKIQPSTLINSQFEKLITSRTLTIYSLFDCSKQYQIWVTDSFLPFRMISIQFLALYTLLFFSFIFLVNIQKFQLWKVLLFLLK